MVLMVKQMQREEPEAKEQWWKICDFTGGGVRDPAKHDENFLMTFITKYRSGERFQVPEGMEGKGGGKGGGDRGNEDLGAMFKVFQRKSKCFKDTWATYCDLYGTGKHDPTKNPQEFLIGFMDFVCRQGGMALGNLGGPPVGEGPQGPAAQFQTGLEPPQKKMRVGTLEIVPPRAFSGGGAPGGGAVFGGSGDPTKDLLVQRVKQFQRSGEHGKEAWHTYADTCMNGVRDPNKHDVDSLQNFIHLNGVP